MKKSLEAVIGDKLMDIRTGDVYTVAEIAPFRLSNGQTYKDGQIKRWFKVAEEGNVTSVVEPRQSWIMSIDSITELATRLGCSIKQNRDHIAIKYGKKNVVEVRPTKKYFNLVFRHTILDGPTMEKMQSEHNGKLVGNGTWTLDYRIQTTELEMFELVLRLAIINSSR